MTDAGPRHSSRARRPNTPYVGTELQKESVFRKVIKLLLLINTTVQIGIVL